MDVVEILFKVAVIAFMVATISRLNGHCKWLKDLDQKLDESQNQRSNRSNGLNR